MELNFHKFLLKHEEINYVCHTHPTNTLKILCSDNIYDFSVYRLFPDQVIFNDKKSCVIPYANPGEELFNHIEDMVNKFIESEKFFPKLILLKNHGIITCGKTIEKSAEIFLSGVDKMNMTYLSNLDINKLINDENEKYRKSLI